MAYRSLLPVRRRAVSTLPLRPRLRGIPRWWRMVDDGSPPRTWAQQQQWAMVLQSRNIPYVQYSKGQREYFYVPPLVEGVARAELTAYGQESHRKEPVLPVLVYNSGNWAVLFFLPLLIWHGLRARWWEWGQSFATPASTWSTLGALDIVRTKVYHEWYRAVTALTLHADSHHVLGNVAFGCIFLMLLCRAQGLGLGLLLTIGGGALGNVCNALTRQGALVSMGFSTALFAAVGALSGALVLRVGRQKSKALVPLAAGGAILAMLGTEGERTDYAAHLWGLGCGVLLGMGAQMLREKFGVSTALQWAAGALAVGLVALCWWWAGLRV